MKDDSSLPPEVAWAEPRHPPLAPRPSPLVPRFPSFSRRKAFRSFANLHGQFHRLAAA